MAEFMSLVASLGSLTSVRVARVDDVMTVQAQGLQPLGFLRGVTIYTLQANLRQSFTPESFQAVSYSHRTVRPARVARRPVWVRM